MNILGRLAAGVSQYRVIGTPLTFAGLTFAQFVMLTPFPGTVDFRRWEKAQRSPQMYPVRRSGDQK